MFQRLLAKILANIYDFAANIVVVINIAINKTFCIHDLVNEIFITIMFFNQKSINVVIAWADKK